MRKTVLAFAITGVVIGSTAAAIFLVLPVIKWKHVTLPDVKPGDNGIRDTATLFSPKPSQAVLTARLPFSAIRELVQKSIPPHIGGEIHAPDSGGISGITARPSLDRNLVKLDPIVGSAPPKISLGTGFHGRVNVKAFKWIIVNLLVSTLKTKSPELSVDIDLAARVEGWVSPGLSPDWMLTHQEHFDIHVDKGEGSTLWGIIHFDARGKIQELVNGAAPGLIKQALDSVAAHLALRAEVEKVWKQLYKPVKLSAQPNAHALLKPERVRLQAISFDDPNTMTVRLAVDGACLTEVTDLEPAAPVPGPLPQLVQQPTIAPAFHVVVPLALDLNEVNRTVKARFSSTALALDGNSTVRISEPSFYAKDGLLYLKMKVHGENRAIRTAVDGDVLLRARPVYDEPARRLRFKEVAFDVETKSTLTNLAAWLLNDLICKRVEKSLSVDVPDQAGSLKEQINGRFSTVEVAPGIRLNSKLDRLDFTGVEVRDGLVLLGFDLSGELSCDVSAHAFKP